MRIVQRFEWQFPQNVEAFVGPAETVKREGVGYRTIHVVRRAIVSFLGEAVRFGRILIEDEPESGQVCSDRRFAGRALMQLLENIVELS